MKKILMLILPIIALIGGAVSGDMLKGKDAAVADPLAEGQETHAEAPSDAHTEEGHGDKGSGVSTFAFPTQFFVPLMRNGDMGAMMIVTLSLETTPDSLSAMQQQEHRLRDALLRQLMVAANTGGFDGNFTVEGRQRPLREGLLKAAKSATELPVTAVLIEDIARQGS